MRPARKYLFTDDEVRAAVAASCTLAEVMRRLGMPARDSYKTLHRRIAALGLDTSHMLGQRWRTGKPNPDVPGRPLVEILVDGSKVTTSGLMRRLIREAVKVAACEGCGGTTWKGLPMPLELHHVNGRRSDNRLENLRILCPNCHAQTPTYRGRNIGNAR